MFVFQYRRGTAAQWTAANPKLRAGEPGIETDTGRFKMGDGITSWENLSYFVNAVGVQVLLAEAIEELNTTGIAGDSAYEVAVNNGFIGTEAEWLLSLKGEPGANSTIPGPSAYELAVDGGFVGTAEEWIESLRGEPGSPSTVAGPDGKSAYQIAVEEGFEGTRSQWIASLKGEAGDDGNSVQVVYVSDSEWPPTDTSNPLIIYARVPDA